MINIDSRLLGEIDANELYLLCYIANRIGKNGDAWPGNDTLLKETGWHIEKLIRIKKGLEARGILKVERKRGRANRYSISSQYISNFVDGKPVNGKSVVVGESDNGKSDNGDNGKSDTDHYGKSDKEVLTSEEVNQDEELTRNKAYINHCVHSIFETLVCCIFTDWADYRHIMIGYDEFEAEELQEITDPTIRKTLEKLGGAARKIYSAFDSLKRPLPDWRDTSSMFGTSKGEVSALTEAKDQIRAYSDYCRMVKQYLITDPEKAPEKLIAVDWCKKLYDHVKPLIEAEKYDPAYEEDDLHSGWLMERYYYQPIGVNVCKRYNNRIVWGGEEYLKVKQQ